MPELLREVIEVGRVAIVAETDVLWLLQQNSQQLAMVVPSTGAPPHLEIGQGWAGQCALSHDITNIPDCRNDELF